MDGFDDLLAPSRKALESNPFADDFGGSSSSDPWASPFGAPSHDDPFSSSAFGRDHEDPYGVSSNPYADLTASSAHLEEQEPGPREEIVEPETRVKTEEQVEEVVQEPSDPLDSVAVAGPDDEEDNRPLGILRTPGFKESVAAPLSTPSPVQAPSPIVEGTTPKPTVASPSEIQAQQSSAIVVSPLEGPSDVLENSLAGLSLGGESLGGLGGWNTQTHDSWGQTELPPPPPIATPTTTTQAADEDSDDDKPINQTLKRASQDDTHPPISSSTAKPDNGLQPVFVITVDDPQKVGDPIRPFTMYTVHTRVRGPLLHSH
jgi:sorting nexin-1/2